MECQIPQLPLMVEYMAQEQKPRRDPIVIDDGKLRLYGPALRPDGRGTMFRMKLSENNPVLEADLGIKTEGRNGKEGYPIKIETPMAPRPFMNLMNLVERVGAYKGEVAFEMDNWGHPFLWDKELGKNVRSKDRMIISRFQIAKNAEGLVTFGVTAKGKDNVVFEFKDDDFHPIMQNGQPAPVSITSGMAAAAWAQALKEVYFQYYTANWKEPEFQKKRRLENMQRAQGGNGGGNGGGGYQQQRPQQQQQSQAIPTGDMGEDDIPF